jgi:deoxyribose-phosphate aldolase
LLGLAAVIEHTLLQPAATRTDIEQLCREAVRWRFATVCVNPVWVHAAATQLRGTGTGVTSVVSFPFGASRTEIKVEEARRAVEDGAAEIDMVANLGALKAGELDVVWRDIAAVVAAVRDGGARATKVILETSALTDAEKVTGAELAVEAGAAFVKTSTGFGAGGATAADVALLYRTVAHRALLKASGGIRTLATVLELLDTGAARIGTSAGISILEEARAAGIS